VVFSFQIDVEAGPKVKPLCLLPIHFLYLPRGLFFAAVFFLLLVVAGVLTSAISMLENCFVPWFA